MYKYLIFLLLTLSCAVEASPRTAGFWQAAPNKFWPNELGYSFIGIWGNDIQKNTAANNPDVFCDSQGSGYRTPSVGEFARQYVSFSPFLNGLRHFSGYENFDRTKPLPDKGGRFIAGGIFNEWGDLSRYGNAWEAVFYWVAEPGPNPGGSSVNKARRLNIRVSDGGLAGYHNGSPSSTSCNYADGAYYYGCVNELRAVACLRDLVPTPLNASPAKT